MGSHDRERREALIPATIRSWQHAVRFKECGREITNVAREALARTWNEVVQVELYHASARALHDIAIAVWIWAPVVPVQARPCRRP